MKNPEYDVTDYISQVRMFTKDNKHNKAYTTSAEFLSGIPDSACTAGTVPENKKRNRRFPGGRGKGGKCYV